MLSPKYKKFLYVFILAIFNTELGVLPGIWGCSTVLSLSASWEMLRDLEAGVKGTAAASPLSFSSELMLKDIHYSLLNLL